MNGTEILEYDVRQDCIDSGFKTRTPTTNSSDARDGVNILPGVFSDRKKSVDSGHLDDSRAAYTFVTRNLLNYDIR